MREARLEDAGSGLAPVTEGWFVVNVRDVEWFSSETRGAACWFANEYGEGVASVTSGYFLHPAGESTEKMWRARGIDLHGVVMHAGEAITLTALNDINMSNATIDNCGPKTGVFSVKAVPTGCWAPGVGSAQAFEMSSNTLFWIRTRVVSRLVIPA